MASVFMCYWMWCGLGIMAYYVLSLVVLVGGMEHGFEGATTRSSSEGTWEQSIWMQWYGNPPSPPWDCCGGWSISFPTRGNFVLLIVTYHQHWYLHVWAVFCRVYFQSQNKSFLCVLNWFWLDSWPVHFSNNLGFVALTGKCSLQESTLALSSWSCISACTRWSPTASSGWGDFQAHFKIEKYP